MVGHQTLNLAIGVRVPASQPISSKREPAVMMAACFVCRYNLHYLRLSEIRIKLPGHPRELPVSDGVVPQGE
jgi:hypothetical protein